MFSAEAIERGDACVAMADQTTSHLAHPRAVRSACHGGIQQKQRMQALFVLNRIQQACQPCG
jgi:hypothetical protein